MTAHGTDRARRRYGRETAEFSRVANLSDAVFAIAMTLLVLTLDVPEVEDGGLAAALVERIPQLVVVALTFAIVASVWWAHHKLFGMLGVVEPGLIALNLVFLGLVALVPFPTSLIGAAPTASAAVMPFIGLFVVTFLVMLLLFVRAHAVGAWRYPMPGRLYPWLVLGLVANMTVLVGAIVLAVWAPIGALVVAGLSGTTVGVVMAIVAPRAYREWAI